MQRSRLDPERWERAAEIFEHALDVPRDARDALIESEAKGDADIIATVRGMLHADENTGELIEGGIGALASFAVDGTLKAGDHVGDFEIISELGRGGMGIVYAARDRKLGRVAALKLLPQSREDPEASDRLVAEAQAASALDHPNVATIYQVGETSDGRRFIAMARYEGETLRERLSRGKIPPREAFGIAKQIASGLAAAHAAGLVHRDVKPENIFLTRQGLAKLLDFGIATLADTDKGPALGTVRYMSPEQTHGKNVGPASDVWSLGATLLEMLNGSVKNLPAPAAFAVSHALEKDPSRRYRDASAFLAQLERAERLWTRPRQIRMMIAAVALFAIAGWAVIRALPKSGDTRSVPQLAVAPISGDSSDRESMELASALGNEIGARIVGLGRMSLVRMSADSLQRSRTKNLDVLRLAIDRSRALPTITASLERSDTKQKLWQTSRPLDRAELREISRDFVIGALTAIGKPLNERERAIIGSSFPSSSQAYEEFLKGSQLLATRTPAAVEEAMVKFRKAAELDSNFSAAYARQSYAYTLLVDWGWKPTAMFPGDPITEGLKLADRATRIDSTSADGWLARAYTLVLKDPAKFSGAIEAFQHAIALDPYNAEAFHQYGQSLMALGRYTEALAAYRRVLDLEPSRTMTLVPMAAITKRLGRKLQALDYLDSAVVANPQIPYARATRALLRAQLGDLKGAREDAEAAVATPSSYRVPQLGALARVLWLAGDTASALSRIRELEGERVSTAFSHPTEAFWVDVAEITAGRNETAKQVLRTVKPKGALAWFMFEADEFNQFRKDREVAVLLDEMDPRR